MRRLVYLCTDPFYSDQSRGGILPGDPSSFCRPPSRAVSSLLSARQSSKVGLQAGIQTFIIKGLRIRTCGHIVDGANQPKAVSGGWRGPPRHPLTISKGVDPPEPRTFRGTKLRIKDKKRTRKSKIVYFSHFFITMCQTKLGVN